MAATETVVHYFNGNPDGYSPYAGLIQANGKLFGTTELGGTYNYGSVFSIGQDGTENVLYSFYGGEDGAEPEAGLINIHDTLYGTTGWGGGSPNCTSGCGTIFSIAPDGTEHLLHVFIGGTDGDLPKGVLTNIHGTLFGTTYAGGDINCNYGFGCGTVFSITPDGTYKVLYTFKDGIDGAFPSGGLINAKGVLYGTTQFGGTKEEGTVYSISTTGTEKVIYSFCTQLNCTDGGVPYAGVINVNGILYGTAARGGAYSEGVVFSLTPGGTETVLHSFGSGADASEPFAGLIDVKGAFYGTTFYGGSSSDGAVFSIKPNGKEKVLYSFFRDNDGANPAAGLTKFRGALFGTTVSGGAHAYYGGTVFSLQALRSR